MLTVPCLGLVFCYQNCSDLLWGKIVLVIEKNFWNSRLKAENFQKFWVTSERSEQFLVTEVFSLNFIHNWKWDQFFWDNASKVLLPKDLLVEELKNQIFFILLITFMPTIKLFLFIRKLKSKIAQLLNCCTLHGTITLLPAGVDEQMRFDLNFACNFDDFAVRFKKKS